MIKTSKYMQGVSLIELMVVVFIIAVIAAIGYPNYQEFSARAKRLEAKTALLKAATNQERIFLQNNQFTTDLTDLGFNASPYTTESGHYRITVTAPTPTANFTVTATYLLTGSETKKCNVFTIDATGAKTSSPYTDCWTRTR